MFWQTNGSTAHSAYPWLGQNALIKLQKIISSFEQIFPTPDKESWKTTAGLIKIETSNTTLNKIPDHAKAYIDVRLVPEEKGEILDKLNSLIPADAKMEFVTNYTNAIQYTPEDNTFVKLLKTNIELITNRQAEMLATHGSSDIRHFEAVGCQGVCFSPIGYGHHSDNEWVDIKSLEDYYNILKNFLLSVK